MYTQCPSCQTIFRVRAEQLRVAHGKVRCSRCKHIFNAVKHLRESPHAKEEEWPESLVITPIASSAMSSPFKSTATDIEFEATTQILAEEKERKAAADEQQNNNPLQEPEKKGGPEEKTTDESTPEAATDEDDLSSNSQELELAENLPFDLPDNLQPIEPSSRQEIPLEEITQTKQPPNYKGKLWIVGAVLMLLIAIGQLTWFNRQAMSNHPEGSLLVTTLCQLVECQLPPRRAPNKIKVIRRAISLHPEVDNTLQIKLTFANKASFIQPYPILQISLFAKDEKLVVRRRFLPPEYLSRPLARGLTMQPAEAVMVTMAVEDPGSGVTGFKLEFF